MNTRTLYKALDVKLFKQTTDHTCGPAALKTFLHHYNLDGESETQLSHRLNTCPLVGTKFEMIQAYMWNRNIKINCERSDSNIDVKDIINSGRIILTEWIDWGGHFVIIYGYNDNHYFLADPEEGRVKVSQDRFHSMWFTKGERYANLMYLTLEELAHIL